MALLGLVYEGDERLRKKAVRIRQVDDGIRKLADDMWETMLDARGVGLAAPQIGAGLRLIVIHIPADYDEDDANEYEFRLANPEIVKSFGHVVGTEGCLSIPGWVGDVPRAEALTVKAIDMNGRAVRIKAENHLAVVLQHEIDHLDGILYTDRVEDKETLRRVTDDDDLPE
ncbi:MAG: peptide deformylase [Thermomicrobiales bacterium]